MCVALEVILMSYNKQVNLLTDVKLHNWSIPASAHVNTMWNLLYKVISPYSGTQQKTLLIDCTPITALHGLITQSST